MAEAYIVATARTAGGRKGGRLAGWHPADLAASVLNALVDRTEVDPAQVEDVIMGCVMQTGEQSDNVGAQRGAGLEAAGERARHLDRPPVRLVAAGAAFRGAGRDVGRHGHRHRRRRGMDDPRADGPRLASLPAKNGFGNYKSPGIEKRYPNIMFSQFTGAEMMAEKYGLSKDQLDDLFLREPSARHRSDPGGQVQGRDRPAADHPRRRLDRHPPYRRRHPFRRQPRRHQGRQADRRERQAYRCQRQPDLRWRFRRDGGQRDAA